MLVLSRDGCNVTWVEWTSWLDARVVGGVKNNLP